MKISLEWLNDYVRITESAEELAEMLSNIGFATEGIERFADTSVIDLEISSNRGDCLSHIGIARELAALTGRELKLPQPQLKLKTVKKDISKLLDVEIAAPHLCQRYTARLIEGVKVGPTPEWMVARLSSLGFRSVNNVVDATNYAMLETGQPPHAFDFAKIHGGKIIIRKAGSGETLTSIDATNCRLSPEMLVIADSLGPVALAGIMGGADSEVSNATTSILLEEASFDPVSVRATSRKLALSSEASFRFERIVDIERIDWASRRTAELIVSVAGGEIVEGVVDVYPEKPEKKTVSVRLSRINKLLGIVVPKDAVMKIFAGLFFEPKEQNADVIICCVPSWRSDICREADLIEEAARMFGYDKIGTTDKINIRIAPADERQRITGVLSAALNGLGFYETINVSFIDKKTAELFSGKDAQSHLAIRDAAGKSANILRGSLLGSLLEVLRANYNAANEQIKIYEIANVFEKLDDGRRAESTKVSILCDSDFRFLRASAEAAVRAANKTARIEFQPSHAPWAKVAADIIVDGRQFGIAGVLSDKVLNAFDIKAADVCAAEIDFDLILSMKTEPIKVKPLPKFPAISRVLSLIVDERMSWSEISSVIAGNGPSELEQVKFDGIYRGKPIDSGKKSVTVSLRFRDEDGTLQHTTVDEWEKVIVAELAEKTGAELRQL